MEGVDRLNELKDEMLVNNIMSRLDCTTKEVIQTTATISKRWKNLWTSLPHFFFSNGNDFNEIVVKETNLHDYISFIDNTLNKCPPNLNLKKFKLDIDYSSLVNSKFKSRANCWIRYAIRCNVEEVDLWLFDVGVGQDFTFEDELFFNTSCITRYSRIDITSESVKKLVFSGYNSNHGINPYKEDYIDCIKINAPYISSLLIKDKLFLWELVLLDVSSLTKVNLDYSFNRRKSDITRKEIFRRLLESLYHVKDVIISDYCWE
ncbi:hypothetical protein Tco_1136661, partial [Tanacetum coccineum]